MISTCTGYLCPGLTSYVAERLGLRADVLAFDLVGQGCGAALPNLRMADALVVARAARHVLSVCVEVSSAAMYLDNDPGVLVSACLFGDGAGAAVLSGATGRSKSTYRVAQRRFAARTQSAGRAALRTARRHVAQHPHAAGARTGRRPRSGVLQAVLERAELTMSDISTWIMHAGGRDVLLALRERIGLSAEHLRYSAAILDEYGNMSSAFVYFVLESALKDKAPSGWWWMSAFGAGFTCHGALLAVGA